MTWWSVALASLTLCSASAQAGERRDVETGAGDAATSLSAARLADLDAELDRRVRDGQATGYVLGIAVNGHLVHEAAIGRQAIDGPSMRADTLFRIASMTKPVTAVAILRLIEQGKLSLTDPVDRYLPEIGRMRVGGADGSTVAVKRPIQVRDLLTHTSGIGYRFDAQSELGRAYVAAAPYQEARSLEEAVTRLAELDLFFQPGERFLYSYGLDVAGRLVEVVSGRPFELFLKDEIFTPLGMADTSFRLDEDARARLADVHTRRGSSALTKVPGTVFGDPFRSPWPSGGAGLISSMPDYLRFAAMLEGGGSLNGVQVLSPAAVALMVADHMPAGLRSKVVGTPLEGVGLGLGVATVLDVGRTGQLGAPGDFTWSGYYDTQFFVSPRYGVAAVLMSQYEKAPNELDRDTGAVLKSMVLAAFGS